MAQFGTGYQSIQSILAAPSLGRIIKLQKDGIPNVFPRTFWTTPTSVDKDYLEERADVGVRQLAPITSYDGGSHSIQQKPLGNTNFKCVSTRFDLPFKPSDFMNLLQYDNLKKQDFGMQELFRQARQGAIRMQNTRIALMTQAIFNGFLYVDKNGVILPTSTNAIISQSYNIPTGNTGQLNILSNGNVLTTGWQNYSTARIDAQLLSLKQQAQFLNNYMPKYAVYGLNVPQYLTQNTFLINYFARDAFIGEAFNPTYTQAGDLSSRQLLGFQWIPGWSAYYEIGTDFPGSTPSPYSSSAAYSGNSAYPNFTSVTGSYHPQIAQMVGNDQVAFLADPSECDWMEHVEGHYPIPHNFQPIGFNPSETGDGTPGFGEFLTPTQGMWGFAVCRRGIPTGLDLFFGDTYGFNIRIPQSVFSATVSF